MEENSKEIKINFVKKNIIEKGLDPRIFIDYLKSKNNSNSIDITDCTLKELDKLINIIYNTNEVLDDSKEKNNEDINSIKINNKQREKKIKNYNKENDERFGVIIPEFINCKKNEISNLSKYDNIEIVIKVFKTIEGTIFSTTNYFFNIKTNPLSFNVDRKYTDFQWLRDKLKIIYSTNIIPFIDENETKYDGSREDKYRLRKRNLERFFNFMLKDPLIKTSDILYDFLSIEKDNEFYKKKKDYDNLKPINEIQFFKTIDGKARININDKKEDYLEFIKESIESNQDILNKMSEYFILLKNKMNEIINVMSSFIPLLDNFINLNQKNRDLFINIESYKQIKSIFNLWSKVLEIQNDFFCCDINEYFDFINNNLNYMNQLVQNTQDYQNNYYESSQKLISKKRELFKKQNTSKWNLSVCDIDDLPNFKKNKTIAYKKIDSPNTYLVIIQKEKYGFYLNRLISEYERMKYVNAKINKDIIISFAMKQQNNLLEYIQDMREILGRMDGNNVPEMKDYEKNFKTPINIIGNYIDDKNIAENKK